MESRGFHCRLPEWNTLPIMDRRIALVPIAMLLAACGNQPTAEDAKKFVDDAEAKLFAATNEAGQAQWVQQNFITQDTEALNAKASERVTALQVQYAKDAAKYDAVKVDDVPGGGAHGLSGHMHHKFALFDGGRLLTGSYNWTRGAAETNYENVIDTTDPKHGWSASRFTRSG